MLSYHQALATLLALPLSRAAERLPLLSAAGRYLAESPAVPNAFPRFDNSQMDGFALRSADAGPRAIVGESAAGRAFAGTLGPGECIRISTGAPMPPGADLVVPVEDAQVFGESMQPLKPIRAGQFIRRAGSDMAAGAAPFAPGTRLSPPVLAALAACNIPEVAVWRRPRVGILASGDELRLHGQEVGPSQIVASSLYQLEAALRACGCDPVVHPIAPDEPAAFRCAFEALLADSDLAITTAGVSVGEHDLVGRAVAELGGRVLFHKVAVRPGKPMLVADFAGKIHLGLPGNPVSTHCNFEIFVKPLLRRWFGAEPAVLPTRTMPLAAPAEPDRIRLFFCYARIEGDSVRVLPNQSSGNLFNPALADALAVLPPGEPSDIVEVVELRDGL